MKQFLTSFVLILCSISIYAQGTIRGNIYDKDSGEPLISATVIIKGTDIGTVTDLDGFFVFTKVPTGEHTLEASYIGYETVSKDIKLNTGQILYESLYLNEGVMMETVEVSAGKTEKKTEVKISTVKVSPKQIKSLPSTGGEADIAQYLPVLPGIVFTGDQGGQLYIRGGSPIQNKILLDGMTIYNPFHSIGFFSVFETEAIKNIDVLTGGFNAEYGGRISAVVDIKTREGNKKRYGGVVSSNPFQSKILLEGPIKKLSEEGGGSSSFILTGKHSYINETSKVLYSYASSDTLGLPYSFTDLYGKASFLTGTGTKLNLFGFNFTDRVNVSNVANVDWNSVGAGADFTLVPPGSPFIVGGNFTFSQYDVQLQEGDDDPRTSKILTYTAGLDFTSFGEDSEWKYGFEFNGFNTDFVFRNFLGFTFQQEDFTTELAGFVKHRRKIGKLVIEPSFRVQYYASLNDFSLEPRLGMKFNATDRLRFKAAGGFYSQNLISTVNERDIVNLFVGFLSGPEQTIFKPGTREKTDHRLQKAIHGIFGVEIDVSKKVELNIEPYIKDFTQLINVNRNKLEAEDPDYATETGQAYGIDFSVKYDYKDLYVWGTYSLGYVNRDDGEQVYPTIFDRRHNVNFLTTYNFGGDKLWEASVRWNLGSGFPFTLTQGFYSYLNFAEGLDTEYETENPDLGLLFSEDRNSGRLPYYHRMDVSLKRTFEFSKYSKLDATLSITNVYNRENIFFFDRVRYERVNQLPFLPSLGLILSF